MTTSSCHQTKCTVMLWDHLEVGFLDGMFATFDCYQHPVVLIGEQALRWMAVGVVTDEDLDLLVRSEQHNRILESLLSSGSWIQVDLEIDCWNNAHRTPDVPRLKRVGEEFYINLWPEHIYGLAVNGDLCEVPHVCAWNPVLIETKFYPHNPGDRFYPRLLSDHGSRYVPTKPDQSPNRPCRTPVFVPTIPRYLDACLTRTRRLRSTPRPSGHSDTALLEIFHLIRYLFLENEDQRTKLLPMLSEANREAMLQYLNGYKRTAKERFRPGKDVEGKLTSSAGHRG